jgi:hypothetical protein
VTTHDIHNRQASIPPAGFEPTISAGRRLQTYALDRAATGPATSPTCADNLVFLNLGVSNNPLKHNIGQTGPLLLMQKYKINGYIFQGNQI